MKFSNRIAIAIFASMLFVLLVRAGVQTQSTQVESTTFSSGAVPAVAGFDGQTNGAFPQSQMDAGAANFADVETPADGLGPLFNATSCADCHSSPVPGGGSQITELRAGVWNGSVFQDHAGGSLINDRALDPVIQE